LTYLKFAYAGVIAAAFVSCNGSDSSEDDAPDSNTQALDASSDATHEFQDDGGEQEADASLKSDASADADASSTPDGQSADGDSPDVKLDVTPEASASDAATTCNVEVQAQPDEGAGHKPECDPVTHTSNPPSSGWHWGKAPAYGIYKEALPRGYYVHSLEHGTVAILYNCPEGCPAEVARAEAAIRALPLDPVCVASGIPSRRVILTPDPLIDVRWAASAWNYTLRAPCFDSEKFLAFYWAHVNHGPEQTCAVHINSRTDDGMLSIPEACRQ